MMRSNAFLRPRIVTAIVAMSIVWGWLILVTPHGWADNAESPRQPDSPSELDSTSEPDSTSRAISASQAILPPTAPTVRLPTTKVNRLGLTIDIQLARQQAAGTIAVKIDVRSTSTFAADRELTLRFVTDPNGQSPPTNGLRVDVPMSLAQGTSATTVTRYLPKWSVGYLYNVSVYEQDRALENCFAKLGGNEINFAVDDPDFHWLLVTESEEVDYAKLPDLRSLFSKPSPQRISRVPGELPAPEQDPRLWASILSDGPNVAAGQAELPTDWRGYQNVSLLIVNLAALESAKQNGNFEAIHDWVLNGGSIALYDAASEQQFVEALGLLRDAPADSKLAVPIPEMPIAGFPYNVPAGDLKPFVDAHAAEWAKKTWVRPLGAGLAFGLQRSADETFPSAMQWTIVEKTLGYRVSPMLRRGVDPILGDRRFGRWLIPGVAQPPVYTFMGLLAVFVILVGPVAYRSTAKRGRTYLMFLIAPVLAIITTVAMFAYGIVSDGFGTLARVRQLTWVDGASSKAGERIQSTYFAGLRPIDGLEFSGDAEVMRYTSGNAGAWETLNQLPPAIIGNMRIEDQTQRFSSAFLPSRQQRQFVAHQSRHAIGHLSIQTDKSDPNRSAATVGNRFAFELRQLVIRDADGEYWFAEQVPGESNDVPCVLLNLKEASSKLASHYNLYRPLEEDTYQISRRSFRGLTQDLIVRALDPRLNSTRENWRVSTGAFENWLDRHLQLDLDLPLAHFVAISDVSEDVIAVPQAELVESVRYVYGTLK